MCTLTWLRGADGYALRMNRDEMLVRRAESGPTVHERDGRRFIAPVDGDAGGTWIAVGDTGVTVCLLNGYVPADLRDVPRRSRGILVLDLADARTRDEALGRLAQDDPARYRSFVLVVVDPAAPVAVAHFDGDTLEIDRDAELRVPLISSAIRSQEVRASRQATFDELRGAHGGVTDDMLAAYHASHRRGPSAHSPCMHRHDAETRSLSHVVVSEGRVRFAYTGDAPCRGATPVVVDLARERRPSSAPRP